MAVLPKRAAGAAMSDGGARPRLGGGGDRSRPCVASFLLALTFLPNSGVEPARARACSGSVVCGVAFRAAERRASDPIFPLAYLRKRNFVFPIVAQSFSNFAYLGGFFLTPLLLEYSFGYLHNQSAVGFLSLPRPIVFSTIAPFAGYLAVRVGERTLAVVGTTAVVLSMGVFALAGHSTGLALVEIAWRCRAWASVWRRRRCRRRCRTVRPRGPGNGGRVPTTHEPVGHRGRDPGDGNRLRRRPAGTPRARRPAARLPHRLSGGRRSRSSGRGRRRDVALDRGIRRRRWRPSRPSTSPSASRVVLPDGRASTPTAQPGPGRPAAARPDRSA